MFTKIKKLMQPLAGTPIHPQWLVKGSRNKLVSYLKNIGEGKVILDVGCYNKWPKSYISSKSKYIGLDYYETAKHWYESVPDVYGDTLNLPIKSEAIHTVLLLDVLEHVIDSSGVLSEVGRVLKPNGKLIMQVPFLYPLHDEPKDYVRFTAHGFEELAKKNGFFVEKCNAIGHPVETSTLLINIAIAKTMLGWIKDKNPAAILLILLPLFILFSNILARIIALLSTEDHFMPYSYQLIFKKETKDAG